MAMLTSVTTADGGSFSIFNINGTGGTAAIRPAADHRRNGELEFDEEALIQALESNPDEIMQLFTAPDGLMAKMEAEIDRAISTRVGREGILVARAGTETGRLSIRNTMLDRINNLNRIIDTLQARYDRQQDRFWNVFSNMEKQFGSLNSQQDFIAGMFGNMF
jgi:flagellar hook-associated protein 2